MLRFCRRREIRQRTWLPRSTRGHKSTGTRTCGIRIGIGDTDGDTSRRGGLRSLNCLIVWRLNGCGHGSESTVSISGAGNMAVARINPLNSDQRPFIAVSMYASWIMPHPSTYTRYKVGAPDVSAHRIISDLSTFIGDDDPSTHRVLAAGDLNMTYGWRNLKPTSYSAREKTVWDRMSALGMEYLGPKTPHGRRVCPSDYGGPEDTENVRTYHTSRSSPQNAYIQLDHVFASRGFHEGIKTQALNCVPMGFERSLPFGDGGEWIIQPRFAV